MHAKAATPRAVRLASREVEGDRNRCCSLSAGLGAFFSILPDCRSRIPCYTAAFRLPALVRRSELQENDMSSDQNTPASGFQFGLANLKPAEPLEKITLTFPDGAKREYPKDITGLDLAKGISPSLAKRTVA